MSNVAKMKEKFAGKGGVTPEQHKVLLKSMKEKEEQAVQIAKARAARYNMTLRSAALQTAVTQGGASTTKAAPPANVVKGTTADDFRKKANIPEIGNEAPKQYTLKSVKATVQAQNTVAQALNHKRAPSLAKQVVEAVAENVVKVVVEEDRAIKKKSIVAPSTVRAPSMVVPKDAPADTEIAKDAEAWQNVVESIAAEVAAEEAAAASGGEKKKSVVASTAASSSAAAEDEMVLLEVARKGSKAEEIVVEVHESVKAALEEANVEVTQEVVESILSEDSKHMDGQEFEMTELKKAIEADDAQAINEAVVKEFLEVHAPEKVADVPAMLEEFKGKEAELMEKLADDHPDPAEKIDAEAMAALNTDDKNVLDQHLEEMERSMKAEEAKVDEMNDEERAAYEGQQKAISEHSDHKDRMLKQQLNIYSAGGTGGARSALMGGRGRGRGKKKTEDTGRTATEFIVSGVNTGGQWEVNPESGDE